jgi:(4-O-methyl)-D-glucuronate---lignin esterase
MAIAKGVPLALTLCASLLAALLIRGRFVLAQQPKLPPDYPKAQYDESKVPKYVLPDPLVMQNGKKVKNTKEWIKKRRPELLELFANDVYGHAVVGRPKEMTWEVVSNESGSLNGAAKAKTVAIYFAGKKDGPKMNLRISLPVHAEKPVPVFLVPMGDRWTEIVVSHGYGFATFNAADIEADRKDGFERSIRAFYVARTHHSLGPGDWGAIGAWAWGMSRAMDYLVTDPEVDAKRVAIMGFSRYGKVTVWAGAQDERFAIVFSGEAGCGAVNLVRRQYGETVKIINERFPYWFDGNFKAYGDRVNELPIDFHELTALIAPRPIYIATAEQDYWEDQRGSFLAAKAAEPVYKMFGKTGLGVDQMPPVETPVGDTIGFHNRKGFHGINDYDWRQFLAFADRHFGVTPPPTAK